MSHWFSKIDRPILAAWAAIVAVSLLSVLFNVTIFRLQAPFWGVLLFTAIVAIPSGAIRSYHFLSVWGIATLAFGIAYTISLNMGLFDLFPMILKFTAAPAALASMLSFAAFSDDTQLIQKIKEERRARKPV
jgi:hypothetical protein